MSITLTKLAHLLTVARLRSFSRAAKELCISQPALSRSIASVEDFYRVRIFDRERGRISITSVGDHILREAELVVSASRTFDHNVRVYGGEDAGFVSLGIGPILSSLVLPSLGAHMLSVRPRCQVITSIKPPSGLIDQIIDDEIEIAVCPSADIHLVDDLCKETVGSLTFNFVARAGHPLAGKGPLEKSSLLSFPLASAAEFSFVEQISTRGLFLCDNDDITRKVVLESEAVWLCCGQLVEDDISAGRLIEIPVADLPTLRSEISAVRRTDREKSNIAREVVEFIRDMLGGCE